MVFSEKPSIPMFGTTTKILRKSIFTFLKHYPLFSIFAAFPISAAVLLSPPLLLNSPLLFLVRRRLSLLFQAAAFPPSSAIFSFLNLKLSETITSNFILIPFSLSFYAISKTSVIHVITRSSRHHHLHNHRRLSISYFQSIYIPILQTQLWVFFIILSVNSACFFIFFFAFNFLKSTILVSVLGCVIYSVFLANVVVICNFAIASSGMERIGGYVSIIKACVLLRGKMAIALAIALPMTAAMAGIEALFQYRVVRAYRSGVGNDVIPTVFMVSEGVLIGYLYSILLVLDFLVNCLFFERCRDSYLVDKIEDDETESGNIKMYFH